MRKIKFVFILVGIILVWTGCATAGMKTLLFRRESITLVSIISNEDVNWLGEDPTDPKSAGPVIRRNLRNDPDLAIITNADEILNMAEEVFREYLGKSPHFNQAEKDTALRSGAYRNARERKFPGRDMTIARGYRFIDPRDKNFPAALAAETGIRNTMFVEFKFTKFVSSGLSMAGTIKAQVEMTVIILDAGGKNIYRKTLPMISSSSIKMSNGIYSQSGLYELFNDAIDGVCFDFFDRFN